MTELPPLARRGGGVMIGEEGRGGVHTDPPSCGIIRTGKKPRMRVSSNRRKRFGFVNDGSRRRAHNNNGPRLNKSNGRNSRKTVQFFFCSKSLGGFFSLRVLEYCLPLL